MRPWFRFVPVLLSVALLAVSVLFWIFPDRITDPVVVFFPATGTGAGHLEGELRHVPADLAGQARLRELVATAISGPVDMDLGAICPPGTVLRALYLDGGTAWVDLDLQFLAPGAAFSAPPVLRFEALRSTMEFNFPGLGRIHFLVDGSEAGTLPATTGESREKR